MWCASPKERWLVIRRIPDWLHLVSQSERLVHKLPGIHRRYAGLSKHSRLAQRECPAGLLWVDGGPAGFLATPFSSSRLMDPVAVFSGKPNTIPPLTHSRQTRSQQTLPNADLMSGHFPSLPVMPNPATSKRRGDKVDRGLNKGYAGLILESKFARYRTNAPLALRQASRPPWIWRAVVNPASCAACTAIAERSPNAQ
jgi:hypothetical protein